jgi:hypothetical protein
LLASIDFSEEQFSKAWQDCELLSSRYKISSGFIVEKTSRDIPSPDGFDEILETEQKENSERYLRATSNVSYAKRFSSFIGNRLFKVLSISGSTSYYSVSKDDDLDFFCIVENGRMWTRFVKSLLLARAFRIAVKNSPWLCLSYVADEPFAKSEFAKNHDALLARDAISARVIRGEQCYGDLLRENSWMAQYFPKLYGVRVRGLKLNRPDEFKESTANRIANLFLYYTAGSYIKIKSHLLNRKFTKKGKKSALFRLRIGHDHCIYESADYVKLRRMYATLVKTE